MAALSTARAVRLPQPQLLRAPSRTAPNRRPLRSAHLVAAQNDVQTTSDSSSPNRNVTAPDAAAAGSFQPPEEDPLELEDITSAESFDAMGEPKTGNMKVKAKVRSPNWIRNPLGLDDASAILDKPLTEVQAKTEELLASLGVTDMYPDKNPGRAIFCNRTLNLRSIKCIGYDMDYTLIHYNVREWESLSYEYGIDYLRNAGCPVEGMIFNKDLIIRGLIIDKQLGNLVKVDRFGFVKRAMHGTQMLRASKIATTYGRELVEPGNSERWKFVNTPFSVSEAVMYAQLVERLDEGALADYLAGSYEDLYELVAKAQAQTTLEGKLKEQILQNPERFVELDPKTAAALLDQVNAGKSLVLITNSDLKYTETMMSYAFDRYMPQGLDWRDLFDMVIVQACKPDFFTTKNSSMYEVVTTDGLMKPVVSGGIGGIFCGGSASQVEETLGMKGTDILYVGDHIYSDAALAKTNLQWRTGLIVRELEKEVLSLSLGRPHREKMKELLKKKSMLGDAFNTIRVQKQRTMASERSIGEIGEMLSDEELVNEALAQLVLHMEALDAEIAPMIESDGDRFNKRWGYLSRAGVNDKSLLQNQIERYADIYTSRVSNMYRCSPYRYFRSPMQSLAHDHNLTQYTNILAEEDLMGDVDPKSANGSSPAS